MSCAFEALAPELIARIALFIIEDGDVSGPPSSILPLTLTSRTVNLMERRLHKSSLTSTQLATELRNRFSVLNRIKLKRISQENLVDDLWTVYLMFLENVERNEIQLIEWANLPSFIVYYIETTQSIGEPSSVEQALLVSLLWLTSTTESLILETREVKDLILSVLQPLIIDGFHNTSFYIPETIFRTNSKTFSIQSGGTSVSHLEQKIDLFVPMCAHPAFLSMVVRLDFDLKSQKSLGSASNSVNGAMRNMIGTISNTNDEETTEPMADTLLLPRVRQTNTPTTLSRSCGRYPVYGIDDLEWFRLKSITHQAHLFDMGAFIPGHLTGLWAGKLMIPELQAYRAYLASAPVSPSTRIPMYQRPLYMRLREHFCFEGDLPAPSGLELGETDDYLSAWLSRSFAFVENKERLLLDVYDESRRCYVRYKTYTPHEVRGDTHAQDVLVDRHNTRFPQLDHRSVYSNQEVRGNNSYNITDIIVTGETDQCHGDAWGHFRFIGRIRPRDGLIILRRTPANSDESHLGTWVFRGYVISMGLLVGRWREATSGRVVPMFEGPFVLMKQEDV